MPFDVSGWVETTSETPALHGEHNLWEPLLYLGPFGLHGDDISDYLFGLAKRPSGRGLFPSRGVPPDCTPTVRDALDRNARFIEEHGEGDFGHTYAAWSEVEAALAAPGAPLLNDTSWNDLVRLLRRLAAEPFSCGRPFEHLRILAWANW